MGALVKRNFLIPLIISFSFTNIISQQNVELVGSLNPNPGSHYSDIWGYTDEAGREYAILTGWDKVFIVDLNDPQNPALISSISVPGTVWHDVKTHGKYAYVVTDGGGDGMKIIDLSNLPNSASLVKTYNFDFLSAHNIFIEEGFAYVIGAGSVGGMFIYDLSDPVNPQLTSEYTHSNYIHDVYVYNDTVYAAAASTYDVVDVTDKSNPVKVSASAAIPGIYAHSGWMTEDKRYFFATDEFNVRDIIVYDLEDRTNWEVVLPSWQFPTGTRVHNLFIRGNYAHIAYYESGYVVLDIENPETPFIVGQYDTYPGEGDDFSGAWGAYPFLPSGLILVSDTNTGLYVLEFTPADPAPYIINNTDFDAVLNTDPVEISAQVFEKGIVTDVNAFYRTVINGNKGEWRLTEPESKSGDTYFFEIPGFDHLTTVEYYFAAADDSNQVTSLPPGGSGLDPAGVNPPGSYFSYQVILAGTPIITSFEPSAFDTTVIKPNPVHFLLEGVDTTDLDVTVKWYVNETFRINGKSFRYSSAFVQTPKIDTVKAVLTNGYKSVEKKWIVRVENPTSIEDGITITTFDLKQNYPNPFNPSTEINFSIAEAGFVNLSVYNIIGEKITELVKSEKSAGSYSVNFSADGLPSGIYLLRIEHPKFSKTIKMNLIK